MKPITLRKALILCCDTLLEMRELNVNLFLKDGDGNYHKVSEIDLMRDRVCCEDEYFDDYEFILAVEGGEHHKLFIEEN